MLAGRLRESSSITDEYAAVDSEAVKILEMQHWLELTDRYSALRKETNFN